MSSNLQIGKDLPNLKITLGLDDKSDLSSISDGEESPNLEKPIENDVNPNTVVNFDKSSLIPKDPVRKYLNKQGAFITGLDLTSEKIQQKLIERAERFGLERNDETTVTQEAINALYDSLGVTTSSSNGDSQVNNTNKDGVRLEAIHLHGVEELSTEEIFSYFQGYGPASIEWIDDFSCNVVWLEPLGAARALLGLSRPLQLKPKSPSPQKTSSDVIMEDLTEKASTEKEISPSSEKKEEVILISEEEDESMDESDDDFRNFKKTKNISDKEGQETNKTEEKNGGEEELNGMPPEVKDKPWRLGIPHPKAKALLMRFATKDDKKQPGAEKRSMYYRKYGNPNYEGMKGLISESRKRKVRAQRLKQELSQYSTQEAETKQQVRPVLPPGWSKDNNPSEPPESNTDSESENLNSDESAEMKSSKGSKPKMHMYADIEESKSRKRRRLSPFTPSRASLGVHSRLGSYKVQSDSEEEEEVVDKDATPRHRSDLRHRLSSRRQREQQQPAAGDLRSKLNRMRQERHL